MRILSILLGCVLIMALSVPLVIASTIVIYDDTQNQLPASQSWLVYAGLGGITQTLDPKGVNLVTDNAASAGYSNYEISLSGAYLKNPAFVTLNRHIGFQLRFELQVNSESHPSVDRAGFSVILLDNDAIGIELGFWKNKIWAQTDTPLHTHGEEVDFDTTAAEVLYALTILGNTYTLTANDIFVLGGALRDYSDFNGVFGAVPYNLPNYLFLGDDTSSAQADMTMGKVTINNDITPPVVNAASAPNVTQADAGETFYDFTVEYTDDSAILISTLDVGDVTIDNGATVLSYLSVSPAGDGTPRTATYRITPPGGFWDDSDNGVYTIGMAGNQVGDDDGLFVAADASLATFTVEVHWADLNGDGVTDLADAIITLQALTDQNPPQHRTDYVVSGTDVNGNDRVGIEELIYILQKEAELR